MVTSSAARCMRGNAQRAAGILVMCKNKELGKGRTPRGLVGLCRLARDVALEHVVALQSYILLFIFRAQRGLASLSRTARVGSFIAQGAGGLVYRARRVLVCVAARNPRRAHAGRHRVRVGRADHHI